jgi:hypothetical protein
MNWYQKAFYNIFPIISMLFDLADLFFKFKYLIRTKSQHFDLMFWLLKAKLVYKQA